MRDQGNDNEQARQQQQGVNLKWYKNIVQDQTK